MSNLDEFSPQELIRIIHRDRFVKEQLAARIAGLTQENLEMLGIVQELQRDLNDLREGQATMLAAGNGDPAPANVAS